MSRLRSGGAEEEEEAGVEEKEKAGEGRDRGEMGGIEEEVEVVERGVLLLLLLLLPVASLRPRRERETEEEEEVERGEKGEECEGVPVVCVCSDIEKARLLPLLFEPLIGVSESREQWRWFLGDLPHSPPFSPPCSCIMM